MGPYGGIELIAQSTQSWMNGLNGCALVQTYVSWNSKNSNAKWPLMWQAGALFDFLDAALIKFWKQQNLGDQMEVAQETHLWLQYAEDTLSSCLNADLRTLARQYWRPTLCSCVFSTGFEWVM